MFSIVSTLSLLFFQFALVKNSLLESKIKFGENNKLAKVAKLKIEEK